MTTERRSLLAVIESLRTALSTLPGMHASIKTLESEDSTDLKAVVATLDLRAGSQWFNVVVQAKRDVYPKDVAQIAWDFRASRQLDATIQLVVCETISPGAKKMLMEEGIGFFDSGGSMFLREDGAYVYVEKPPPKSAKKAIASLFSGRSAQVLHTLLVHHKERFGIVELAERAGVAPATASKVVNEIEKRGWLEAVGQGPNKSRLLREPGVLLDAWAKQLTTARPQVFSRYYVPVQKSDDLIHQMSVLFMDLGAQYAITGDAAGNLYTPFISRVSVVRCRMLAGEHTERALHQLGAKRVSEGFNLGIIEAKSDGEMLFSELVNGICLASPIQTYLDLLRGEGRSKELAAHLREDRIGF